MNTRLGTLLIFILFVSACSFVSAPAAPPIEPTETLQSSNPPTIASPTATTAPEPTATPTATFTQTPESSPTAAITFSTWEGLPIMPDATIQLQGNPYVYTVPVSIGEVEQFYLENMELLGWSMIYRKESDVTEGPLQISMDFQKDNDTVRMGFIDISTEDETIIETIVTLRKIEQ